MLNLLGVAAVVMASCITKGPVEWYMPVILWACGVTYALELTNGW